MFRLIEITHLGFVPLLIFVIASCDNDDGENPYTPAEVEWVARLDSNYIPLAFSARADGGFSVAAYGVYYVGQSAALWNLSGDGQTESYVDVPAASQPGFGYCAAFASDGGVVFPGHTVTPGLVKVSLQGSEVWSRDYAHFAPNSKCYRVVLCADGGFLLAMRIQGTTDTLGDIGGLGLIRTNSTGDPLWTGFYIAPEVRDGTWLDMWDDPVDIVSASDGGFYIVCTTVYQYLRSIAGSQVRVLRVDSDGNELWSYRYGNRDETAGAAIEAAGGLMLAVNDASCDTSCGWSSATCVWRIAADGMLKWQSTLAGIEHPIDVYDMIPYYGGALICGSTWCMEQGDYSMGVVAVTAAAQVLQFREFEQGYLASHMAVSHDSKLVICGTGTEAFASSVVVLKLSRFGL